MNRSSKHLLVIAGIILAAALIGMIFIRIRDVDTEVTDKFYPSVRNRKADKSDFRSRK